ncbi:TRAP transporter small permease subunit [Chachezhania sediminis]|uniref:TRAP transporter small permease subunit n=1 Tax=Chachezhania sediminis TaxID=2599291 RepID=UPI00131CEB9E|nr:TRAP transporter small permease subunit [Chachezhania sediminis]
MPKPIRLYCQVIDRIADWIGVIAMYLIFLMVGILLLDAITRNVIDIPLHWCIEAAQFTLAAYYFMGGAKTMKDGDHVRMDLLYDRLSERGKHKMDIVTLSCLMFYLVVLMIGSISSLEYAIQTNEHRFSMWNPSMIPIKSLMVGCIFLMIAQTVSEFFKHIAALRGEVWS